MAFTYTPHDWVPNELITEDKLDHIESGIVDIVTKLKTVAETGSYDDLESKPQINGHELTGDVAINTLGFANVATSGSYSDLSEVPTKVSDFENDQEYQTKTEVAAAVANAQHIKIQKEESLPDIGTMQENIIYLVPNEDEKENNVFDEYIKIDDKAELIGTTKVDLSNYVQTEALNEFFKGATIDSFTITLEKKDGSSVEIQLPQELSKYTNDSEFTTREEVEVMIGAGGGGGSASAISVQTIIPTDGWQLDNTLYKVDISTPEILATDTPIIDLVQTGNEETDYAMRDAWSTIIRIVTDSGKLTVYAFAAPSVEIPIQLKVVR